MKSKLLLLSGGLLGLALGMAWFANHSPIERGKTSDTPLPEISQSVADSAAESFKTLTPKRKPPLQVAEEPSATSSVQPPEDPDEAREWARQNPKDASAWLMNAPAGPKRDTVAEMVCAQVALTDPAQAVALAERYAGGCSNLLENMVHQWADRDEPAAHDYALKKAPGEERDRLLGRVAFVLSKENPTEAARLVVEEISPGEAQNEAVMSVLHQWALRGPEQAFAWAQLFPEGALRERALKEVENLVSQTASQ